MFVGSGDARVDLDSILADFLGRSPFRPSLFFFESREPNDVGDCRDDFDLLPLVDLRGRRWCRSSCKSGSGSGDDREDLDLLPLVDLLGRRCSRNSSCKSGMDSGAVLEDFDAFRRAGRCCSF